TFSEAVSQGRLRDWLQSLPPPQPEYAALRDAYARYLRIAAAGGWPLIEGQGSLPLGARGAQVDLLRRRLAIEDGVASNAALGAPLDSALAEAIARFQTLHGFRATGVIDASTLQALNVPAAVRAEQIRANLERWRWAPRVRPQNRVEVNIAGGVADLY